MNYMRRFGSYLLGCLLVLTGCEKVKKLSDNASVDAFTILSFEPATATWGEVIVQPGEVILEVAPREDLFPLSLRAEVRASGTTDDILGFPDTLHFPAATAKVSFHLISDSGVAHPYTVSLKPLDRGTEILRFELPEEEQEGVTVTIDSWDNRVSLAVNNLTLPYTIHPRIWFSPGASQEELREYTYTFEAPGDATTLTVTSPDGLISREWRIELEQELQLPNAGFEYWTEGAVVQVNPMPGKGYGWATANNVFVQGTLPMPYNGGKAASMTTGTQRVPLLGHYLIAAGSLYTGFFQLSMNFEDPRSMTHFGIPHKLRIQSVSFDAQYVAGPQLMQAIKESSGQKYTIIDIPGVDQGQAWVELLHWSGSGALAYHGKAVEGLTVLGRGEFVFDGANTAYHQWQTVTMPVVYTNQELTPTHIAVVFSSSKEGDLFKGAPGSVLNVDNVILNY